MLSLAHEFLDSSITDDEDVIITTSLNIFINSDAYLQIRLLSTSP